MKTLRELYIETGAIKPRVVLRMDTVGHIAASQDMEEYYEYPYDCEIPLEQVPEYVLDYWRAHVKL